MTRETVRGTDVKPVTLQDGDAVPDALAGTYVAIGNFDGLHLGHQYLIGQMQKRAAAAGKPASVLTFEPHPRQFFQPQVPFFRLTPVSAKCKILARIGLDGLFVRAFNAELAATTAEQFIALLHEKLHIGGVVVGHDFHFGRNREGTPERLEQLCRERGIDYAVIDAFTDHGHIVSSSLVREALENGDVSRANSLLGYRWFISGTVVHGAKRGRELGFPTANIELDSGCRLRHGVYSVRAALPDGTVLGGVASFGRRPMFDNGAALLEVNLFDFEGDLYDKVLDVEIIDWIREEKRFAGIDELVAAIREDAETARLHVSRSDIRSIIS
jgi:riboflavin kinase/FMN adenylyltransferase